MDPDQPILGLLINQRQCGTDLQAEIGINQHNSCMIRTL
jgi:hypothetical protein